MATMRACVMGSEYKRVFTWYLDGTVVFTHRDYDDMVETWHGIHTRKQFDDFLRSVNVEPLGSKMTREKELVLMRKEADKIPF